MRSMQEHGGMAVVQWFHDVGEYENWARFKIPPFLCQDKVTTNIVEAFNAILHSDRRKLILSCLEGIRRTTMVRHSRRRDIAESLAEDGICPKIAAKLVVLNQDSRSCKVYNAGDGKLEVRDGESYLSLDLDSRTCTCGRWQISGIPCKHAIRAILHLGKQPEDFYHEWFSVKKYKEDYGMIIHPIGDTSTWKDYNCPELLPPPMKRSIGRPSKNRRREDGEPQNGKRRKSVKCKNCNHFGHNARTCRGGLTAKQSRAQGVVVEINAKKRKQKKAAASSSQPAPVTNTESTVASDIVSATQPDHMTRSNRRIV